MTITDATTLAELREHLRLANVISFRVYPPFEDEARHAASLHHATGFHVGYDPTETIALDNAFSLLQRALPKEST